MPLSEDGLYRAIGERIRAARLAKGLTGEQLGAAIGMVRASISNMEGGRQHLSIYALYQLAEVLDVPLGNLLPDAASVESITIVMAGQRRLALTPEELEALRTELAKVEGERDNHM